jgi:hypothetical protein
MKNRSLVAKICAIALAICALTPISASAYGTRFDNGRNWTALPDALSGYGFGAGLAVSADGSIIYVGSSQIRFSQDGGQTWSNRSGAIDKINSPVMATSSDGSFVVAVVNQERTWISNNYGVTWTAALPTGQWQRLAMSSTGQFIAVTNTGGFLYVSQNYGASFTRTSVAQVIEGQDIMSDVAMSADGSKVMVSTKSWTGVGKVFLSNNYGASFSAIPTSNLPIKDWQNVEVSGDGMTLLASSTYDVVWISRDGGSTWALSPVTGVSGLTRNSTILSSAISYDGSKIALGLYGTVVISIDTGRNWETRPGSENRNFYTTAMSQDGLTMFANDAGTLMRSLPSKIWFDVNAGTVTIMNTDTECPSDTGTVTSVTAQSVLLINDTATVSADTPSYFYFTETNTALFGAGYDYGSKQLTDCSYSKMTGNVTVTRGPFIASSGAAYSETTTAGNTDFVQYIGNMNSIGTAYTDTNPCGNIGVANINVANRCDFSVTDGTRQGNWTALTQGVSRVWRSGISSATTPARTGVVNTSGHPALMFVIVKALKSRIQGAPANTSWVATETFTVTTA